jgi:hypothetical protein
MRLVLTENVESPRIFLPQYFANIVDKPDCEESLLLETELKEPPDRNPLVPKSFKKRAASKRLKRSESNLLNPLRGYVARVKVLTHHVVTYVHG